MDQIVAIISDAAKVMESLANLLGIDQQLCIAHGIHLGVTDVVYISKKDVEEEFEASDDELDSNEDSDDESDFENDGPEFEITDGDDIPELVETIKELIDRLRKVVIKIHASPVKVYELEEEVKKWQKDNDMDIKELVSFVCISIYQSLIGKC